MKLGPVVQEEMSFKEKVYERTTDRRPITIAHLEPSAQVILKSQRKVRGFQHFPQKLLDNRLLEILFP